MQNKHIMITGCTGFVGKVVLAELLRQRKTLGIAHCYVLIRAGTGKKSSDIQTRFQTEIATSRCFSLLEENWTQFCTPIAGDVTRHNLNINDSDQILLNQNLTHIIHCAASIKFDLPLAEAADINIKGALNVHEWASQLANLTRLVDVSTAYVTPHTKDHAVLTAHESLVELNIDPAATYHHIQAGQFDEFTLLAKTGHPNTYTFTKCLAEHLLSQQHAKTPHFGFSIVRPSIVSACWRYPFAGWIDSQAAFAGFVALIGAGALKVVHGEPDSTLDIVPCDIVAARAIEAAFADNQADFVAPKITYAAAGTAHNPSLKQIGDVTERYFAKYPLASAGKLTHLSLPNLGYKLARFRHHTLPYGLARGLAKLQNNPKKYQKINKLENLLIYLNQIFPYFTTHRFDFVSKNSWAENLNFNINNYLNIASQGIAENLLGYDRTRASLGGKFAKPDLVANQNTPDLFWALTQPEGNIFHRSLAYGLRKAIQLGGENLTIDLDSITAVLNQLRENDLLLILPTHRSYMDFLLCSYLFFALPKLGVKLPKIAATEDFKNVPILGKLFEKAGAFYIKRGIGRIDPSLVAGVRQLVLEKQNLEFFPEGMRSRTGRFLPPKTGLLKTIQDTGQSCVILPLAMSYDRVPEEAGYLKELRGAPRQKQRLLPVAKWISELFRGKVDLGRAHIAAGNAIKLDQNTPLPQICAAWLAATQAAQTTSTHQLGVFLTKNILKNNVNVNVDVPTLRTMVEARGITVLETELSPDTPTEYLTARTMAGQWMHAFYGDLAAYLANLPENPALNHHLKQNFYLKNTQNNLNTQNNHPHLQTILAALFAPICADYGFLYENLPGKLDSQQKKTVREVVAALNHPWFPAAHTNEEVFLGDIEDALHLLVAHQILTYQKSYFSWVLDENQNIPSAHTAVLSRLAKQCAYPCMGLKSHAT